MRTRNERSSRGHAFRALAVLVPAVVLPLDVQAQAQTEVWVQNNTTLEFRIGTTLHRNAGSGSLLPKDTYEWVATRVPPGTRTRVLWFNRRTGVPTGEEYVFSTDLTHGSSAIILGQKLQKKTIGSNVWYSLAGPGFDHGWHEGGQTYAATWRIGDKPIRVKYRGSTSEIEYVLQEPYTVESGGPERLNVLTYNVRFRGFGTILEGRRERARLIPQQVKGYDVIVFQEAFAKPATDRLLEELRSEYPHQTDVLGSIRGLKKPWNGGVVIVSRWPIEIEDEELFGDVCHRKLEDCRADKGVLYAKINKNGRPHHIFGTHLERGGNIRSAAWRVQQQQLRIIRQFIQSKNIPSNEPVIIAGDMNISHKNDSGELHRTMRRMLRAEHPEPRGLRCSSYAEINEFDTGDACDILDYVLYSRDHLQPVGAYNEIRLIRADDSWGSGHWDLSDHYPVYGRFEFPTPAAADDEQRVAAARQGPLVSVCRATASDASALRERITTPPLHAPNVQEVENLQAPATQRRLPSLGSAPRNVVAFTADGGWTLARGTESFSRNIPDEAYEKLQDFTGRGKSVDAIAFTPTGGWTIVAENAHWTRNVGGGYFEQLQEVVGEGKRVRSVAFNPGDWQQKRGYVIAYEGGVAAEHIPEEMCEKLKEFTRTEGSLDAVAFTPDGGWTVVAGKRSLTRNVGGPSPSYYETLTRLLQEGRRVHAVRFNPRDYGDRKGWLILTEDEFYGRVVPAETQQQLRRTLGLERSAAR